MSNALVQEFPFVESLPKREKSRIAKIWDRLKSFEAFIEEEGQVVLPIVAASLLDVCNQRVSQMTQAGLLKTVEFHGRTYITVKSIEEYCRTERKAGRPLKSVSGNTVKEAWAASLRVGKAVVEESR